MEIKTAIEYLTRRRAMVDEAIMCLERLSDGSSTQVSVMPAKRRGRKFMAMGDRQKVSQRMKAYWASSRVQRTGKTGGAT